MYPSDASEPTVVYKEPLFADEHCFLFLINVFIRNSSLPSGCKILQLCEYDANMYRYDAHCE